MLKLKISLLGRVPPAKVVHVDERQHCDDGAEEGSEEGKEGNCSFAVGGAPSQHHPAVGIGKVGDGPDQEENHRNN